MPLKSFSASTLALLGSAMLSLWIFFGEPSINIDGVIYLNSAQAFLDNGIAGAVAIYGWPFYSILIATVSELGISLTQAAALLNILFFSILAWAFVAATEQLYPQRRAVHYLAAVIILFEPYINSLRSSFFRDNGQLAFTLLSLVALLSYLQTRRPRTLAAWVLAVITATLFRPEAVLLLLAGVIAIGIHSGHKRATLLWLAILAAGAAVSVLLLQHFAPDSRVRDLVTWGNYYLSEFGPTFSSKANLLEKSVLGEFSDNGREALIAALVVSLVAAVIGVLTPLHAIVLWLQRKGDTGIAPGPRRVLIAYTVAAFVPPLIFITYAYFVSQRYMLAFALLLLLLVAPRLMQLFARMRSRPLRMITATIFVLFFVIASYRNLRIDTEVKDAGKWLAQQQGSVWTNSLAVSYYVQTSDRSRAVTTNNSARTDTDFTQVSADWVAIKVAKRDTAKIPGILQQLNGVESKRFEGSGRFILVIKR